MTMINDEAIQVDAMGAEARATSGNRMGPIDTYRSAPLSSPDKKAFLPTNTLPNQSISYPYVDENVLRIWGLRLYENGVIGWEVGMEPA